MVSTPMKIVMMDRDDYLSEQRKQADEETSKVIDETLESVDDYLNEFDQKADAAITKTIDQTLADFQSELDEMRSQINELEQNTTLQNQALRALVTAALSGERQDR
jgi:DNA-binding transcriptional regulator GbsR (MarR family)